ncbi:DUF6580 family putative transport protein [Novipirellula artificiosorum]|uniref:Uncharacterized protein n=1 Tax=Novipirellula artificiosorum TaxID=2528016 RepID=A0A5C6E596_9BACT|nr:DUF6580 family putative transport protein [Novipirellula artificiosorum]TWU42329.1 hypothetical protein Poly41_06250 [Novipirellula artificiosorum]
MFYLLILTVAASRFLPHPPNVACVAALGLFAGCYMQGRRAYLVPLAVMLLSDLAGQMLGIPGLGFYNMVTMSLVYAGLLAAVPIGRKLAGSTNKSMLWKAPSASLLATTLFFLLSNFGVWLGGWYSLSVAGLVACYVNAIPFYGLSAAGDLFFTVALFGTYELSRQWNVASLLRPATA